MPNNCAVFGCNSSYRKKGTIIFHKFPKTEDLKLKWIRLCKRKDKINGDKALICSLHFKPTDYKRNLMYELLDKPVPHRLVRPKEGAFPSLNLPTSEDKLSSPLRNQRKERRGRKRFRQDTESTSMQQIQENNLEDLELPVISVENLQQQLEDVKRERDALLIEKEEWEKERAALLLQLEMASLKATAVAKEVLTRYFS